MMWQNFYKHNIYWWRRVYAFGQYLSHHFIEDSCLRVAASLAYTTLLSAVPLMAVVLTIFSAFPVFQSLESDIRYFIFSNFVPTAGEVVQKYFSDFTTQAGNLTAMGIGSLIFTSLLLLRTIDTTLNGIWRIRHTRKTLNSFMVYWVILTLGPILLGISIFVTSYLISLPFFSDFEPSIWKNFLAGLPFITTSLAFTLLYLLIPNRAVPWLYAVIGGVSAALLFEVAKKGFALYVTQSDLYQTVYGALATIPLFLIWIYVSWVVILLGAEITYCLSSFRWGDDDHHTHSETNQFIHAYRLIGHLWHAQKQGQGLSNEALLHAERWQDEDLLRKVLEKLSTAYWIHQTQDGGWVLVRDLSETTLLQLYRTMAGTLAVLPQHKDIWNSNLTPILKTLNDNNEQVMHTPLKQFYSTVLPLEVKAPSLLKDIEKE